MKNFIKMIRFFDILFSIVGIIFLFPIMFIMILIGYFDTGSPLFIQPRLGKDKKIFNLYKFRTMKLNTLSLPTHLINKDYITNYGKIVRKLKFDELPQLFNVLKGEMSIVGPRPNLVNQDELIYERDKLNIYKYLPGITGISQINNISMDNPKLLAESDSKMVTSFNYNLYFYCILRTCFGAGYGDQYK